MAFCDILHAKEVKIDPNVMLNLTFLTLFIWLFFSNFVFFEAFLKLIPLFTRYMNMYHRVLYTKQNLRPRTIIT